MSECEKLHDDLKAFLDGQLSPATRIAMRMHLNRCESCRREIEEMRTLGSRMRSDDDLAMSAALRERILASIPTAAPEAKVKMLPRWREKPVLVWGACASAALAWFLIYPAISSYQDQRAHPATATSTNQTVLASQLYTQDYDASDGTRDAVDNHGIPMVTTKGAASPYNNVMNGFPAGIGTGKLHTLRGTVAPAHQTGNSVTVGHLPSESTLAVNQVNGTDASEFQVEKDKIADWRINAVRGQNFSPSKPQVSTRWNNNIFGQGKAVNGKAPMQIAQNDQPLAYYAREETAPARRGQANSVDTSGKASQFIFTANTDPSDLTTERQVHREANLTVEVANAEQQSDAVERLVKESKGYVANNQLTTQDDNTRQATLICKVPVDQFDTVMGQFARLGLLKGKTLSGEDITEKVSDEQETGHVLRADINTTEAKLKERRRHSETVRDEETLRQLRIRVAQSQARLKMLTRLGMLSEITVELDEKPKNAAPTETKPGSPFMQEVSGTGQAAARSFVQALRLPIQLLVWIVVYSPLWALLIFAYRRMTR